MLDRPRLSTNGAEVADSFADEIRVARLHDPLIVLPSATSSMAGHHRDATREVALEAAAAQMLWPRLLELFAF